MKKALGLLLSLVLVAGCAGAPSRGPEQGNPPQPTLQVTQADNGKTIELKPGQSFALMLGESPPDWEIAIADQKVVARVPNVMPVRGSQGIFRAHAPGSTELQAVGTYPCQKATPPCKIASPLFRIAISVKS